LDRSVFSLFLRNSFIDHFVRRSRVQHCQRLGPEFRVPMLFGDNSKQGQPANVIGVALFGAVRPAATASCKAQEWHQLVAYFVPVAPPPAICSADDLGISQPQFPCDLTHFETVHGSKRDAVNLLPKRLAERGDGQLVRPTVDTVADYARHWLTNIAPGVTANKTRERYAEHLSAHVIPVLGHIALQKLEGTHIDAFYAHLRAKGRRDGKGGLAPATVAHIHKVLTQILKSALKARKLRRSPMDDVQAKPKARQDEISILDDRELAALLAHLRGHWLYMPVLLTAATGLRRGELLALRWSDVDLSAATLRVAQVMEFVGSKISFKAPKTERSRRTMPCLRVSSMNSRPTVKRKPSTVSSVG